MKKKRSAWASTGRAAKLEAQLRSIGMVVRDLHYAMYQLERSESLLRELLVLELHEAKQRIPAGERTGRASHPSDTDLEPKRKPRGRRR